MYFQLVWLESFCKSGTHTDMYMVIIIIKFFKVKPAFLSDIQFFGQSSRKRCLENATSSSTRRTSYRNDGSGSSVDNSGTKSDENMAGDNSNGNREYNSGKNTGDNSGENRRQQ